MNVDDRLHGEVRNGVLVVSGNNPAIKVDGGCLVISDGPHPVMNAADSGIPAKDRMVTRRFPRADCGPGGVLDRIIATRPNGFVTLAALKWMHEVGIGFMQLDWHGEIIATVAPAGQDRPTIRRAQALAAGDQTGLAVMREILRTKIKGQATVARLIGRDDEAIAIDKFADDAAHCGDGIQVLSVEAAAAAAYWKLWTAIPLRFARREAVPEHWQSFGSRQSPLSASPRKATTPAGAVLNYLHGVAAGEMSTALAMVGFDPGIGIFHADRERRASLSFDAVECVRPYVEGWFLAMIGATRFSKRDFGEEIDGAIHCTRPLTSYLAMTAPLWRQAATTVAEWLADSFARIAANQRGPVLGEAIEAASRGFPVAPAWKPRIADKNIILQTMPPPLQHIPTPGRLWHSRLAHALVIRSCWECGTIIANPRTNTRFCSNACANAYHGAMRSAAFRGSEDRERKSPLALPAITERTTPTARAAMAKFDWERRNAHRIKAPGRGDPRSAAERAGLTDWYASELQPRLAGLKPVDAARALGVSAAYARSVLRYGVMPHPRHFAALAALVGIEPPPGA